jgi:hypothetical protein
MLGIATIAAAFDVFYFFIIASMLVILLGIGSAILN